MKDEYFSTHNYLMYCLKISTFLVLFLFRKLVSNYTYFGMENLLLTFLKKLWAYDVNIYLCLCICTCTCIRVCFCLSCQILESVMLTGYEFAFVLQSPIMVMTCLLSHKVQWYQIY